MKLITFPRRRLGRVRFERNPYGPGWMLSVDLGPGAGYRWMDFGPYKMSVHARWYERLSISGRTLRLGRNVKVYPHGGSSGSEYRRWGGHWFTRNANVMLFPGWW